MYSLSGGCGYCLSNHIYCDLVSGSSLCPTCRNFDIKCPPVPSTEKHDVISPEAILPQGLYTDSRFDLFNDAPSPIHWMVPLDHYKHVAHDLLGYHVSTLPDVVAPTPTSTLPAFIQQLPCIADDDVQFLAGKGVFNPPQERLQNELLKTFILHVHPYLPILDLPEFLGSIANHNHSPVSLLLYYAVMFSSIAFVDPEHIHRAGYPSRRAARQEFFQKARVLYDFDVEHNRAVIIQSVLLMTYWHETPEDPKDFRHWLEIALSQAAMIAFPDADRWSNDTTTSGLWKRIWWCMYTRDRLVALNLRRHTVISDEEFTVPLPTLADFDIQQYPERVIRMLGGCAILSHLEQQEQLAQMFIEKCKLCRVLSDIVAPVSDNSMPATTYHSTALVKWHSDLPSDIHYQEPPSQPLSEGERALFAYRAWLKMLYLTASRAQHRQNPQSSMPSPNSPEASLQSLTNSIASIAEGLHQHDLIHCLPTTTVGLLMPVLATHFMNIRSETPDLWQNAFQSLYQCLKALEKLGEVYALAESMATFFQSAICGDEIKLSANGGIEKDFLERVLTPGEMQGFEDLVRQERSLVK